jgi:CDP-glucose 4,6-dehydratase
MSFWRDRNVLITGATGFLGVWLTRRLLEREANIVALVRDMVPQSPFFLDGLDERAVTLRGAVEDSATVERALHEYEIDAVFHLAAQAIVGVANRDPVRTFEANIQGTWCVLDACRRHGDVSRVVIASSDKAYGDHDDLPYDETFALQGRHPYDVSKSCADLIATAYHHTYDLPVCITRCGNLFGPGDLNFSRIVPGTIRSVLDGERPIIRSDGSPIRDYVHVTDISLGYLALAEQMDDPEVRGKAFNFGTGEPKTVLDLTNTILRAAGREDMEPIILDEVRGEIRHQYLSNERAVAMLGWTPGAAVEQRLEETIEWYREYFKKCRPHTLALP